MPSTIPVTTRASVESIAESLGAGTEAVERAFLRAGWRIAEDYPEATVAVSREAAHVTRRESSDTLLCRILATRTRTVRCMRRSTLGWL
jgi:hypothetical protein